MTSQIAVVVTCLVLLLAQCTEMFTTVEDVVVWSVLVA